MRLRGPFSLLLWSILFNLPVAGVSRTSGQAGSVPRAGATSPDLTSLTLSVGKLSPEFASNVFTYAASVAYTNSAIAVFPASATDDAKIQVVCAGLTNVVSSVGSAGPIALKAGANVIQVAVTSPGNPVTTEYVLTVTRTPPNIVLVLVDDQGFSDWGCYGSEIPTPHLDHLASEGLRFRQFYNGARCSPTRCSILTGLYPQQAAADPAASLPALRTDNNVTLAEVLQTSGYRTYMAGKWHLGSGAYLPEVRGFQHVWRYADGWAACEDNWDQGLYTLSSQDNEITNRIYGPGQFYQTDAIGDYSVDFVNNALVTHADGKPFFLYMAFGAAHYPLQAPRAMVDTNTAIYTAGWDALHHQRYANMLAQGVIDPRHALSHSDEPLDASSPIELIPPWNALASDRQADLARRMAIYAAMVEKMDENVGRVVETLRQLGELDNTLIIALSDNGGNSEGGRYGAVDGVSDGGPLTGSSLANIGQSGQPALMLGGGWANVNNTPFRLFKHFDHEGGIRTPMIVHWPQGLSRTNQWETQPCHLIDIMSTVVDVAGATYPTHFNGHPVLPREGRSLKPLFTDTNRVSRTLGFEHEGNRGWICGSWKFVSKNFALYDRSSPANQLELYDLSKDPVEMTNLAASHHALLDRMVADWNYWAARVGVPHNRFVSPTALLPPVTPAKCPNDLFVDSFARPDNPEIDASSEGMWGSRMPPLGAAAYYASAAGARLLSCQLVSSNLQMAVKDGMSDRGIRHNFIGQDIIDAGGFSVELTVKEINSDNSDPANRYVGFGVGLSAAEVAAADTDAPFSPSAVTFRGGQGENQGVSDFFVELDLNGCVKVWNRGALLDTVPVGQNCGTLTASFALTGFTTNDTVTVRVFFNGQPLDINTADTNSISRSFKWNRDVSNYIGLSARASNYARVANLAIRRLPLAADLAINYALRHGLSGVDSAPDADPDGDGVSNFAEWAFGGNPAVPDPWISSLKAVLVTATQDFQFSFQRLINAAAYGLHYRFFMSEDAGAWSETMPVQLSAAVNEDAPSYEIVTMQLPASEIPGKSKLFLRVMAEPAR